MSVTHVPVDYVAGFTDPLVGHYVDSRHYMLTFPFQYYTEIASPKDEMNYISVEFGFRTDFASIPRIFWIWIPPNGQYGKAAVIHDYLYKNHYFSRKEADMIFLEAMEVLNVSEKKRKTMYRAVRMFGWFAYKKGKRPLDMHKCKLGCKQR